jgi:curli biogenesis system outer membrane secretion channel CsgG
MQSQEDVMTIRTKLFTAVLIVLALSMLAACGGTAPATLSDIPVYPDAVELKPGESPIANTLAQNNQNDAALRAQLGTGGKTEQKGFNLPKGATWDQVKSFYDDKLKAGGWSTNSLVSGIMDQANQGNDLFHVANWQRGTQNVSIVMVTSPTNADEKQVLVSLSSQ